MQVYYNTSNIITLVLVRLLGFVLPLIFFLNICIAPFQLSFPFEITFWAVAESLAQNGIYKESTGLGAKVSRWKVRENQDFA